MVCRMTNTRLLGCREGHGCISMYLPSPACVVMSCPSSFAKYIIDCHRVRLLITSFQQLERNARTDVLDDVHGSTDDAESEAWLDVSTSQLEYMTP